MADDIHYEIILYWNTEDQAFIAEVPELPGCAADGGSGDRGSGDTIRN
jgi:predicted RNase H-like HicB family nuclease